VTITCRLDYPASSSSIYCVRIMLKDRTVGDVRFSKIQRHHWRCHQCVIFAIFQTAGSRIINQRDLIVGSSTIVVRLLLALGTFTTLHQSSCS